MTTKGRRNDLSPGGLRLSPDRKRPEPLGELITAAWGMEGGRSQLRLVATIFSPSRSISQHHQADCHCAPDQRNWRPSLPASTEQQRPSPCHALCRPSLTGSRCPSTEAAQRLQPSIECSGGAGSGRDDMEFPEPGTPHESFSTSRCLALCCDSPGPADVRPAPLSGSGDLPLFASSTRHEHTTRCLSAVCLLDGRRVILPSTSLHVRTRPPLQRRSLLKAWEHVQ
jgi:hypothetical protein